MTKNHIKSQKEPRGNNEFKGNGAETAPDGDLCVCGSGYELAIWWQTELDEIKHQFGLTTLEVG